MASSHRKPQRKSGQDQARRQSAWTGARASPTYSPSPTPRPQQQQQPSQPAFPPLSAQRTDPAQDRLLTSLAGLTGTTITLRTKNGQHYEAVIASTSSEGDTTGVTLKDAKDLSTSQSKDQLFVPVTNIESWASGPADAPPPVSAPNGDTFRTDTDISQKKTPSRPERILQAWSDDLPPGLDDTLISGGRHGDDVTFGLGSSSSAAWDQFAINEKKFGITTQFDEDLYTTKLDRSAADFKERERKAQRIANEIIGSTSNNPHILEERNMLDDGGANEENKYGAVVRGQNAYVPPGARKGNVGAPTPPSRGTEATKTETPKTEAPKAEVPKVSVNGPDGATVTPPKDASPAPAAAKPPADALPAFRDFVSNEKQRLNQKRMALVKNDMDKRMAELVKFSQSFKLNKPVPEDLVPILAKDENKQQAIREKSTKDAASIGARAIGSTVSTSNMPTRPVVPPSVARLDNRKTLAPVPKVAAAPASAQKLTTATKPTEATKPAGNKPLIQMHIQAIPPFKGSKSKPATTTPPANGTVTNGTAAAPANVIKSSVSSTPSNSNNNNNKLNVNASSFRPGTKGTTTATGSPSIGSASSSPKPKEAVATPPNPFFGAKPIKKGTPVNVKDDFNPFKNNKITEASAITALWPYTGKRYSIMFPPPQHQPQPAHVPPHMQQPPPPPSYEEDTAAQAAARGGYVYMYPPYAYPGQHMMPGMPPPGPPGAYMPAGPFMQAMPYPPGMPPPNMMYAPPTMGQVPPPGAYMQPPPPGAYPPPNGAGPRPSVPPTPIPAHAHPYYPQSPQLQHAMPYQMMMPPPGTVPQHAYEPGPNGHA